MGTAKIYESIIASHQNSIFRLDTDVVIRDMQIRKLKEKLSIAINTLKKSKISHAHNDEDHWYSCPKSGKCANDHAGEECNCGADIHNSIIDEALKKIEE